MSESYVVFGAYGGVGSALCRRLAKKGAICCWQAETKHVWLAWRRSWALRRFPVDATNLRQVESCVKQASELYGVG